MPRRSLLITATLAALVTTAAVIVVPVVQPASSPLAAGVADAATTTHDPIRVAVAGDSLSAGTDGFLGNGLGPKMWMTYANGGVVQYVGGYAHPGYTPDQIAASLTPVKDVDVLVILAGTNAVRVGKTLDEEKPAYERMIATMHPKHVIVAAIPPYDRHPAEAVVYDRQLERFVKSEGWDWTDPWTWARTGSDGGSWRPGITTDGTHPATAAGYRELGLQLRKAIIADGADGAGSAAKR